MLCLVKRGEERRDGERKREKERERKKERRGWRAGGRVRVGSERDEASEGRRKWNGEKARHEARYFPRGERSLFTSPLSESAPTGVEKEISFFLCGGSADIHTHIHTRTYTVLLVWQFRSRPGRAIYLRLVTSRASEVTTVTQIKNTGGIFDAISSFLNSLIRIPLSTLNEDKIVLPVLSLFLFSHRIKL